MEQCVAKKRDEWLIGWSDFGLIFSFLGVTTHPCRPKDPRIWKLAKKFNFIHGLRKFLAKSGKCVYNYIHIYIRVEEGEGERVSTLWLQAHSTVRHAQPVEERRCLLYNPWVCQSLTVYFPICMWKLVETPRTGFTGQTLPIFALGYRIKSLPRNSIRNFPLPISWSSLYRFFLQRIHKNCRYSRTTTW